MIITSKLEIDLLQQKLRNVVYAVQNDSNTRAVEISLLEGSTPWSIPPGTTAIVGFKKPDGKSGSYDTLPDGETPAATVSDNKVTAILAPQVLTCAGRVEVNVALFDTRLNRLGVFPFPVFVAEDPSAGNVESEDYYWLSVLSAIGDLSKLSTNAKDSIVNAINELYSQGGPSGGIAQETDPTVPEWAKQPNKPTYTAAEVHALPDTYTPPNQTAQQVGADPVGTAAAAVAQHNTSGDAHSDLRVELKALTDKLNAFFDSDDQTLDELSEIVAYIQSNKSLIEAITTSKVSVADIVNNLTTNVTNKPLSAAQGVALKALIDAITIPTKLSQLTNDKGYLTEHQDISGKLDASALPTAINTALAQAKASGEFDGDIGPQGDSGVYIGEEEPTDASVKVWIKPDGESDAEGGIPAYVKEEAENVADRVIATRTINSLVLLMASDIHVSPNGNARTAIQHMGAGMAELRNTISPDGVVLLGDYNYGQEPQSIAQGIESMKLCRSYVSEATKGVPTVWLNGNHDYYGIADNEYRLSDDMVYALVGSHNTVNAVVDADNVGRNYGYVDFEKQRIRLVYLNTTDINGAAYTSQLISTTQGQWLINTALDLTAKGEDEEKWGVVICSHFPAFLNPQLPAVLGAFKDKTRGSNFGISYNFTSAKAELIATFHGHIHNFKVTDMATGGGNTIKAICIPNAVPGRENPYTGEQQEVDSDGNAVAYPKTAGTAEDTSFCAVVIDRDNKTVHAICYGAGYDREIVYGEEETEDEIVNQIPISTDTSGAVYNGVGYADGIRVGSDGTDRTGAATDATGYIPVSKGDVLYFSNCQVVPGATYNGFHFYKSDKTYINQVYGTSLPGAWTLSLDDSGNIATFTVALPSGSAWDFSDLGYIRVTGNYIGTDSIITINQPIA